MNRCKSRFIFRVVFPVMCVSIYILRNFIFPKIVIEVSDVNTNNMNLVQAGKGVG